MKNINKNPDKEKKSFSTYSFEDFLQDDFFLFSIENMTEETQSFWKNYWESSGRTNQDNFDLACSYLKSVQNEKDKLTEQEIFEMWKNIELANKNNLKKKVKRSVLFFSIAASVAAIFILATLSPLFLTNSEPEKVDLASFSTRTKNNPQLPTETQLILSENESISLKEKESTIDYASQHIEINGSVQQRIPEESKQSINQLVVPIGKRAVLSFSDGSKIWVNSGTRVTYPAVFADNKREIYVDGEIYTEVVKDTKRPFIVKTNVMDIEVLGTRFNVNAYESDPLKNVVLVSGSVKIKNKDKKDILLSPNKKFETNNGYERIQEVNATEYISWIDGFYQYDSERMDVILKRLSRYYGQEIVWDSIAADMRFSGKLDLKDDLNLVLLSFTHTAPITYRKENGKYIINYKY